MKTTSEITVYEVDGKAMHAGEDGATVSISSDWCYSDRITITAGGKTYTVVADEVRRAVENAVNVRRY
jgi:hypothetical protein